LYFVRLPWQEVVGVFVRFCTASSPYVINSCGCCATTHSKLFWIINIMAFACSHFPGYSWIVAHRFYNQDVIHIILPKVSSSALNSGNIPHDVLVQNSAKRFSANFFIIRKGFLSFLVMFISVVIRFGKTEFLIFVLEKSFFNFYFVIFLCSVFLLKKRPL
jgi:hypothetical protein